MAPNVNAKRQPFSVSEAARELGVNAQRVRAMIAAGALAGVKIGGRWLVDPSSVAARKRAAAPVGRPFSARRAWGLLLLASGQHPAALSASEISRLRGHLRQRGLRELVTRLRRRATTHALRAHPADLPRLAAEPKVARTGVAAAEELGLDVSAPGQLELYVPATRLPALRKKYALQTAAETNLLVRAVDGHWPLGRDAAVAPILAVAVDLAESADARTRRAGERLLAELLRRWST